MRVCPICGYCDPPIWRHKRHRLFTCYCHLDDLKLFEPDLAEALEKKRDLKLLGYIYHLTLVAMVEKVIQLSTIIRQDTRPVIYGNRYGNVIAG